MGSVVRMTQGATSAPASPATAVRSPARVADRAAAVLGLIGAVLYTDWVVLEPLIGRDLSSARSYVSELGALTHPGHGLVNALDVISGLCIMVFSVRLARRLPLPAGRLGPLLGCAGLSAFGAATALNALWPMTCAPSVQAACAAGGMALRGRAQDVAYTALSAVAVFGVEASMLALGRGLRRSPGWAGAAQAGRWIFAGTVPLTGLVTLLGLLERDVGLPQRALIVVQAGWVATLAVQLLRAGRRAGRRRPA